jgi:hypothetical protein
MFASFTLLNILHYTSLLHNYYTVFLDYGSDWQAAWDKYVKEWSPLPNSDKYMSASMIITDPLRTAVEQLTDPYPNNIIFYCHYDDTPNMTEGRYPWEEKWLSIVTRPCKVLSRREVATAEEVAIGAIQEDGTTKSSTTKPTSVWYYYTMAMLTEDEIIGDDDDDDGDEGYIVPNFHIPDDERDGHVLVDVPRHAIKVQDRLYSKDEFLKGKHAFRHEIMLPDEIFPEAWRNN